MTREANLVGTLMDDPTTMKLDRPNVSHEEDTIVKSLRAKSLRTERVARTYIRDSVFGRSCLASTQPDIVFFQRALSVKIASSSCNG